MRFELAKRVIFENKKIHPILATMDADTKDAFFSHFYNYPAQLSFTREIDNAVVKKTIKQYISGLPDNEGESLVEVFLCWKKLFDKFEKKVLNVISDNPGSDEYLFLRSKTFLNNKELWEKGVIDNYKYEIYKSYHDYRNCRFCANEYLAKYYLINDNYDSKILANLYTHQLYHLVKTMEVSGFSDGEGFSLVPLMIKYEDVYETPIEEHEIWNQKF